MAQKRQERSTLQVSLSEAEARIREQIEKGQELLGLPIRSEAELKEAQNKKTKWSDFNAELLKRIVDTDELYNDYYPSVGFAFLSTKPLPFYARVEEFHSDVKEYMVRLESILERLRLIPELPALAQPTKEQPETLPIAQIFVCYAREDEEKVENLYQKLSDAGFKPWMAKKDLVGGEIWQLSIQQAIRRSDFVVVCLSAISVNKRSFVQREIKDALDIWREKLESDIYLIPVRLEDCEVPESLRDFQWVNLFEGDGWARLVEAIQEGMKRRAETLIESITPSRTPPPATRRSVAQIGDTIPDVGLAKKDLSMKLIGWAESDIAVRGPYKGNELYTFTAKPRMKFIILEFEFHNNWVRQQETPYFNKGEVRTDKGYFYQVWSPPGGIHSKEYAPRPSTQAEVENLGGSGAFKDLLPEESVRGHVVFEIPEDEEPEEVELSQVPVPIKLD